MDNNRIILNELKSINKRLDGLEQNMATKEDVKVLEKGQIQTNTSIANITTALEAVTAGQKEQAKKKDIEEVKIEIQNLGAKQEKILKNQDRRIEDLEDHADIPHHN